MIKAPVCFNKKYYDDVIKPAKPDLNIKFDNSDPSKLWLPMQAKKSGKIISNGEVRVQIDALPKFLADKNPVGKARDQPNHSPQLPQPQGRLELSFNPIKMFNQLVGPALRRKIYMGLCLAVCVALFIAILPNIMGQLITNALIG